MDTKKKCILIVAIIILVIAIIFIGMALTRRDVPINSDVHQGQNEQQIDKEKENPNEFIKENNGVRENVSEKISNATFKIDELVIDNIKISEFADKTTITANVSNHTTEDKGDIELKIKLLDQKGETIKEAIGYIGSVKATSSAKLNCEITLDYANAYDIAIEKK